MTEKEFPYPQFKYTDNKVGKTIFHAMGDITEESKIRGTKDTRPLSLRAERAELYKQIKETKDLDQKKQLIEKAHDFDYVFDQFLNNRKDVSIGIDNLGEQSAQYVILEPPKVKENKTPIVLMPGISNDLDGVGDFPLKLALSGRKVVMIAYPESWFGKVTKRFGDAVKKSDKFGPHTTFFREAINKIVGQSEKVDLCGISTGAIITSELVKDKDFNKRVDSATMIIPPGIVKIKSVTLGMVEEIIPTIIKEGKLITRISVFNPERIKITDENRKLMLHTYRALEKKVCQKYEWWKNDLTTGSGKKTRVINCNQDRVTKGYKGIEEVKLNKSLIVKEIEGGHTMPAVEADKVIEQMEI